MVGRFSCGHRENMTFFSNTYSPRWRDYSNPSHQIRPPNFQNFQSRLIGLSQHPTSNPNQHVEDLIKALATNSKQFQQKTRSSIQNLKTKMSQQASSIDILEAQG